MMRGRVYRLTFAFLLALTFTCVARGQTSTPQSDNKATNKAKPPGKRQKPVKEQPELVWLERAETLTEEIREEEWRLDLYQRPLLLARLAEAWWETDIKRARPWMESAVAELEFQPQNESLADMRKRLGTSQTVLSIVLPLDKSCANRLLKLITEGMERAAKSVSTKEDTLEFSRLTNKLVMAGGVAARNKDFEATDRVYRTLVNLKDGNQLQFLSFDLRNSDAGHADKLFAETLEAVRTDYHPSLIFGLGQVAYPEHESEPSTLPAEELRRRYLDLLSEALLRVPKDDEEQKKICSLRLDAARLLSKYPPERMGAMQSVLDDCKRHVPVSKLEASLLEKKLETIDDFLKAAEEEDDLDRRASYKMRAAGEAHDRKDYIQALEIVNSLSDEERNAHPSWVSAHGVFERDAVQQLYRRHDYPAVQRVIDRSPTRPQTLLNVAETAFLEKDQAFGITMLSEARRSLEKTRVDQPHFYWLFFNIYARYIPSETAAVFKETILGINAIKPPAPDAKFRWSPLSYDFHPLRPPAELLDLEPHYISATIKLLDSPQERTAFRLSVLGGTLRRYNREKKEREQKRSSFPEVKGRDSIAAADH